MSVAYTLVQWNRHKKVYDALLGGAVAGYLAVFVGLGMVLFRPPHEISTPILLMRALGTCAVILLHVILLIGPAHRFTPLVAPVLYNRRHMGVMFFALTLMHALVAVIYYGGFGSGFPLLRVLAHGSLGSVAGFPFELLGFLALLIFFVMAATSHDFWLRNLTPRVWKPIHMGVYAAYVLVLLHVALGAMQADRSMVYPVLMGIGFILVAGAHLAAGLREVRTDTSGPPVSPWIDVCDVSEIPESRAKILCPRTGERIAIFRNQGTFSAVSNVCAHQGGPLGEGRIIDGCITCPWHGYQYLPHNGQSPPPFTEKIPTYQLRIQGSRVLLDPTPLAPGTPVPPVPIPS